MHAQTGKNLKQHFYCNYHRNVHRFATDLQQKLDLNAFASWDAGNRSASNVFPCTVPQRVMQYVKVWPEFTMNASRQCHFFEKRPSMSRTPLNAAIVANWSDTACISSLDAKIQVS